MTRALVPLVCVLLCATACVSAVRQEAQANGWGDKWDSFKKFWAPKSSVTEIGSKDGNIVYLTSGFTKSEKLPATGFSSSRDVLPTLDGAMDNWKIDEKAAAFAGCRSTRLTLGEDLIIPAPILTAIAKSPVYSTALNEQVTPQLVVRCAPTRQDVESPRCFTDYGKFKQVARAPLPRPDPIAQLKAMGHLRGNDYHLPLSKAVDVDLGARNGQNAAQCVVRLEAGVNVQPANVMSFRVSLAYLKMREMTGDTPYFQYYHVKTANGRMIRNGEGGRTAVLRSVFFPSRSFNSVDTLEYTHMAGVDYFPPTSMQSSRLVQVVRALSKSKLLEGRRHKLPEHSTVWDSLAGRVVGLIPNTRLMCTHWYHEEQMDTNHKASGGPVRTFTPVKQVPWEAADPRQCPIVLSHRTVISASSKEGSLSAARKIAETRSADGIEIDIFLVKNPEKHLVVTHDEELTRIVGLDFGTTIQGMLAEAASEIPLISELTGCPILTPLTEFLDLGLKHPGFMYDLELKPGDPTQNMFKGYREEIGEELGRLLRTPKYMPLLKRDQIVVSCFDSAKTKAVNAGYIGKRNAVIVRTARAKHIGAAAWIADAVLNNRWMKDESATAVVMHYSLITKKLVDDAHAQGKTVGTYTIYDQQEKAGGASHDTKLIKQLMRWGIDWMESDDPIRLRHTLSRMNDRWCPSRLGRV